MRPSPKIKSVARLRVLRDDLVFVVLEISEKRACSAWIRDQIWSNSSFGGGLIGKKRAFPGIPLVVAGMLRLQTKKKPGSLTLPARSQLILDMLLKHGRMQS